MNIRVQYISHTKCSLYLSLSISMTNTLNWRRIIKTIFLPNGINAWSRIYPNKRNSGCYNVFCNALLKCVRLVKRKTFSANDSFEIKMLTRLRLRFSNLRKLKDPFKDDSCKTEAKTRENCFLCCRFYNESKATLMNDFQNTSIFFLRLVITILLVFPIRWWWV